MRKPLYATALAVGVILGLLGSQPLWIPAVIAVLVFPVAASVAERRSRPGRGGRGSPLGATTLAALAGGLLATLAIRLAVDAPGWLSASAADCGGPSTSTQQLVLWASALTFAAAALPVAITLFSIARRLGTGYSGLVIDPPLSLYPVAVSASGLALIACSYVTAC